MRQITMILTCILRYNGYDALYLFEYHEFKDGDVKLIPVSVEDFLGKKISERFEDEVQKHSWWDLGGRKSLEYFELFVIADIRHYVIYLRTVN